jgi:hypothetical protein
MPSRLPYLLCFVLAASACTELPDGPLQVGSLTVAADVAGATLDGAELAAYELDLVTGARGALLDTAEPLDDGRYRVEVGAHQGGILLELTGRAARYDEPGSGASAAFDAGTVLRAVYRDTGRAGGAPSFDFAFATQADDLVINAFTELAVAYADERARLEAREDWQTALTASMNQWQDHLGIEFWRVVPRSLTEGRAGPLDERLHAGVLANGFSFLAAELGQKGQLSRDAVSSLALLRALETDLGDGRLDGQPAPIRFGACDEGGPCVLSHCTLRRDWADAIRNFLVDPTLNRSGLTPEDVATVLAPLTESILGRERADLFLDADCTDMTPPAVVPIDIAQDAGVAGTATFTLEVRDATALPDGQLPGMDGASLLSLDSLSTWTEGDASAPFSVVRTRIDPRILRLEMTFDSTRVVDGRVAFAFEAVDAVGNTQPFTLHLVVNNAGAGLVTGTVAISGPVRGAEVVAYAYNGGILGDELGRTRTDEDGGYELTVEESPGTTSLLFQVRKPADEVASYVEMVSGAEIALSNEDLVEAVIADYQDGATRTLHIHPLTHLATALARGRFATNLYTAAQWPLAVTSAYRAFDEHVTENAATPIDIRETEPADLTNEAEAIGFTASVRLGLVLAALGERARADAVASSQGPETMNTLSLMKVLAQDLSSDGPHARCADLGTSPCNPILNGRNAAGTLRHGDVFFDSYLFRNQLAAAMTRFITANERDKTTLSQVQIDGLRQSVSLNTDARLFPSPEEAPPLPFDQRPPCLDDTGAPTLCYFDDERSPAAGAILRGDIAFRAVAGDNRRLYAPPASEGFFWRSTPEVPIRTEGLDTAGGVAGPWVLLGSLDTDLVAEGPVTLTAVVKDAALQTYELERQLIIDRTPPVVSILGATDEDGGALALGGVTGSEVIQLAGRIVETNGAVASFVHNEHPARPVGLGGDGSFLLDVDLEPGLNTLSVSAVDPAGNGGSASATLIRDVVPPSVEFITSAAIAATIEDEATYQVSIAGSGAGSVQYMPGPSTTAIPVDPTVRPFSKFATRRDTNLLRWRLFVADDHTSADAIGFEFRILRSGAEVVGWRASDPVRATGFNREVTISRDLHPSLLERSGTYALEARARDAYGNVSPVVSASWTQTILPPPLRWTTRAFTGCDPRTTRYYTLGDSGHCTGAPGNNFSALLTGNLPERSLRIAAWQLSNPNPMSVRVRLSDLATLVVGSVTIVLREARVDRVGMAGGVCSVDRQRLDSADCYAPPPPGFVPVRGAVYRNNIHTGVELVGAAGVLPRCSGCAANERELPAGSTFSVYALTPSLAFLDADATAFEDLPSVGRTDLGAPITNVTGIPRVEGFDPAYFYRVCVRSSVPPRGDPVPRCDESYEMMAVKSITQVTLSFRATARVEARLSEAGLWGTASLTGALEGTVATMEETETGF